MVTEMPYSEPNSMIIPIGVARTVIASSSFRDFTDDGSMRASVIQILRNTATNNKGSRHKLGYDHGDQIRAVIDVLDTVRRNEELSKVDQAALEKFYGELVRRLERQDQTDRKNAEEQARQNAKIADSNRQSRIRRRELTMSTLVEDDRDTTLREIAVDYGLNIKDPQIRAALIAAFHAGVHKVGHSLYGAMLIDDAQMTEEQRATIKARDEATFDKARLMAAEQALVRDALTDKS